MECLVKILLWSTLVTTWTHAQLSSKFSKKEVFFVNLEEGFFGCQVNETLEVLQIFKIEKLCDGISDCYLGSDENQKELKCSSKYLYYIIYSIKWMRNNRSVQRAMQIFDNIFAYSRVTLVILLPAPPSPLSSLSLLSLLSLSADADKEPEMQGCWVYSDDFHPDCYT